MFEKFKDNIMSGKFNDEQLFQKYIVDSGTHFFYSIIKDVDAEYIMKNDIANVLHIHLNDIYIVGSGKTGFSMKIKSAGKEFDSLYNKTKIDNDKSDIDIAIVSSELFEYVQESIYDWSNHYRVDWNSNSYYADGVKEFGVNLKYKFLEYLGKGWYRPDFAPPSFQLSTKTGSMKNIIDKYRARYNRKISYGIYRNWNYFKKYQIENITSIRINVKSGGKL